MAADHVQRFVRLTSKTTGEPIAHPELRPRMLEDVGGIAPNLTEVAIVILATEYGVEFTAAGRKAQQRDDATMLNLRLPVELFNALDAAAARVRQTGNPGWNVQDEIRRTLSSHYGLPYGQRAVAA